MAYVAVSPLTLTPSLFGIKGPSGSEKPISARTKEAIKQYTSENLFKSEIEPR